MTTPANPRLVCALCLLMGPAGNPLQAEAPRDTVFYAARCPKTPGAAWGILERDGAGRDTDPYLSSLVGGEAETGSIGSPPFKLAVDTIRFTIRGHDGPEGGRDENYIALLDNKTGRILRKTPAPGNDALQPREWDVAELRGRDVRVTVVDGIAQRAFAWLGIGRIDAGAELTVDFRNGLPDSWKTATEAAGSENRPVRIVADGPVPFRTYDDLYTWVPEQGTTPIAIGTRVKNLYVLGCTVPASRVLTTYGYVDVVYADDSKHTVPLVYGLTLEGVYKLPTRDESLHLLPVGDATRYLLAIRPDDRVIRRIELRPAAGDLPRPRVAAITCQLDLQAMPKAADDGSSSKSLVPLPMPTGEDPEADRWLQEHTVPADGRQWPAIGTAGADLFENRGGSR